MGVCRHSLHVFARISIYMHWSIGIKIIKISLPKWFSRPKQSVMCSFVSIWTFFQLSNRFSSDGRTSWGFFEWCQIITFQSDRNRQRLQQGTSNQVMGSGGGVGLDDKATLVVLVGGFLHLCVGHQCLTCVCVCVCVWNGWHFTRIGWSDGWWWNSNAWTGTSVGSSNNYYSSHYH